MNAIAANDLKTRGVRCLDATLGKTGEAAITVRGTIRYMVLTPEKYARLREAELDYAIREAREDIKHGRIAAVSVAEHVEQLKRCTGK